MKKIQIFVCYAHENTDWVADEGKYKLIPWLQKQLNETAEFCKDHVLKRRNEEEYSKILKTEILNADIAILMISQDFATSKYIIEIDLPIIKAQYDEGKIKIVPLLITTLSKSSKENISWIFDLQTYPNDTKSLINFIKNDAEWENIKIDILDGIENKIILIKESGIKSNVINNTISPIPQNEENEISTENKKEDDYYIVAIDFHQKAISKDPNDYTAYFKLGSLYIEKKEYENAIYNIQKAIEINSDFNEAYCNLGIAFHYIGEYDKAIINYQKAININPSSFYYLKLGRTYQEKKDFNNSVLAYKEAIKKDSNNLTAYSLLGLLYYNMKDYENTILTFQKYVEIDPNNANINLILGQLLIDSGKSNEAFSTFQKNISDNPNDKSSLFNLGSIYYSKGDYENAIKYCQKAISIDPNYDSALLTLGSAYRCKGEFENAISIYQKAISTNPNFSDLYKNLGNVYYDMKDNIKFKEYYKIAAKMGNKECQESLINSNDKW